MKTKKQTPPAAADTFQSSITVSNEVVCEDDECIGKVVEADAAAPAERRPSTGKHDDTAEGSSISVGGRRACTDEACIGRT